MTNAWKQWDFSGLGLQTLNLELSKQLRRRPVAYGLWAGFPLGLHAFYLRERRRGFAYLAASAFVATIALALPWPFAALLGGVLLVAALWDLATLDGRLTAYNKAVRIALSLRKETAPPQGFRGRYTDEDTDISDYLALKNREQAGHSTRSTIPASRTQSKSFQEQEAALRELMQREKQIKNRRS